MLGLLILVVVTVSAVWVYIDATNHRIGKQPNERGFFNLSAGGWGAVVLLLWIVAFPCYLAKRSDLIAKAKKSPVLVTSKAGPLLLIVAGGGLLMLQQAIPLLVRTSANGMPSDYIAACADYYYNAANSLPNPEARNKREIWLRTCSCASQQDGGRTAQDFERNLSTSETAHIDAMKSCLQ